MRTVPDARGRRARPARGSPLQLGPAEARNLVRVMHRGGRRLVVSGGELRRRGPLAAWPEELREQLGDHRQQLQTLVELDAAALAELRSISLRSLPRWQRPAIAGLQLVAAWASSPTTSSPAYRARALLAGDGPGKAMAASGRAEAT